MSRTLAAGMVVAGFLFVAVLGGVAQGMATRDLGVDIEVFRPWGFLGIGAWEPLETTFVSMEIARLDDSDAERVAELRGLCAADASLDAMSCATLMRLDYVFRRHYAAEPVLGAKYRVALTNKTSALLGVVLEIDGLNTNGGGVVVGTSEDKKWVLLPNQTARIAGWQVSTDEALSFRFATPSHTLSPLDDKTGAIRIYVYVADPVEDLARGTEAGELIEQSTVQIPFRSLTSLPVDLLEVNYARSSVSLGILCEETDGPGIRISEVVGGTIAELRGLQPGDIITYINAVPISSCSDFQRYLGTRKPGDRVVVKVHRTGSVFLLTLELEE